MKNTNEMIRRETKALTLMNEAFGTLNAPRRHRVWTHLPTPFPTLDSLYAVAGRLPSTERTSGGRPVWRLTRPDPRSLPHPVYNAPYWKRDLGRGDLT